MTRFALPTMLLLAFAGCPGKGGYVRTSPAPSVDDVVARLAAKRAALSSFTGASVMDYWLGKDRVKGDVLVMGKPGAHVRFAALSPAGGDTIVDMACDGHDFAFVDKQNNCQLTGPCDRTSIGTFLRVELAPEDFVALALGTPPVIADAKGTVTWDPARGAEVVELASAAGKQSLVIDTREGRWDVVESKLMGPDGTLLWSVENRDFGDVTDVAGKKHRVPAKSKLVSPQEKADLQVEWKDRELNKPIEDEKFQMAVPAGLPRCGAK
ncbi:MAG: hypothetical protein NT062_31410 [Proteobacteria bacterium]|nr:hypothetical protein [Pseudomonadota bacterium]